MPKNKEIIIEQEQEQFFLWDYLKESDRPIVMYGTGDGADKILDVMQRYSLKPVTFTTSGDFGMNKTFRGYPVLPFEETVRRFRDFIILICFGSDNPEVLDKIYSLADKYEVYAPDLPVTGEGIYTPDYIEENKPKLDKVRKLLADEKSRQVFDGWLEYRLSGKLDVLESISDSREQMMSLFKFKHNEFFIDAGAFKGDTVEEFLRLVKQHETPSVPKFDKIVAIEPDANNHMTIRRKFYAYGSAIFIPINAAAWDKDEVVTFTVKSGRAGTVAKGGVGAVKRRQVEIPGVKIDTLCSECKPTYIKIDVEGAEAQVLAGARAVIIKHRPKILVSLYHRIEDMFELPLLLHSYFGRYKFYLRKTRCFPGWEFNLIVTQ
jgi:FkbM family methyltransferase